MTRHISGGAVAALFAVVSFVTFTGCGGKPAQNAQAGGAAAPAGQPLVDATPAPATKPAVAPVDPSGGSAAAALTNTMENWARGMEPLITKRAARKGEPSVAEFLDPDELRIGPPTIPAKQDRPPDVVTMVRPVLDSTQSVPNQGAALNGADRATGGAVVGPNAARVFGDGGSAGSATAVGNERPAVVRTTIKQDGPTAADLQATIAKNLRDNPRDVWAHLDYQLWEFLRDKQTPQLEAMSRLSGEDRELLTAIMDALTNFRNAIRSDGNMLVSRKVRALLDLADRLRAQAELVIPTLALCTRVDGFGVYEPVDPARFTAMKEHPIIVYCEVENFASHQTNNKMWETRLSQEVVLYTETGLPVWKDRTENIPDLARNRRHDFFVVKKTKFPANITIGRYLLKVTVVDQQASRVAEQSIPVVFVAQ